MNIIRKLDKREVIELLNKCWMTHDGMWFYHCMQKFGIGVANRLNKEAIASMAPMEVAKIRETLGISKRKLETFEEFKTFFDGARILRVPDFMNAVFDFPRENILRWEFEPEACFAYKGITRIGAIDQYECGVLYRIECWLRSMEIPYEVDPQITGCLMHSAGYCSGEFCLDFQ